MTEETLKMWAEQFYDDYGFDPPSDEILKDYIEEQEIWSSYDTMLEDELEGLDENDLY